MGRFLNPKALKTARSEAVPPPHRPPQKVPHKAGPPAASTVAEPPPRAASEEWEQPRSMMGMVGMVSLGFYMISPELNDLFTHYFGFKSYVSVVSAILLALAFLAG